MEASFSIVETDSSGAFLQAVQWEAFAITLAANDVQRFFTMTPKNPPLLSGTEVQVSVWKDGATGATVTDTIYYPSTASAARDRDERAGRTEISPKPIGKPTFSDDIVQSGIQNFDVNWQVGELLRSTDHVHASNVLMFDCKFPDGSAYNAHDYLRSPNGTWPYTADLNCRIRGSFEIETLKEGPDPVPPYSEVRITVYSATDPNATFTRSMWLSNL
jgi:hypothetical protein